MKKAEELKMKLSEVLSAFEQEHYDVALQRLQKAGKIIVVSLNAYNRKH